MTYILLLGFFAFFVVRASGKRRTITPRIVREEEPERRLVTSVRREPPAMARTETAAPVEEEMLAPRPAYLLGGRSGGGPSDTMSAAMDMMSGPGLLTPRGP